MKTMPAKTKKEISLPTGWCSKLVYVAAGVLFSASPAISQVPPTSVEQSSGAARNDYFHSGAGARYLRRAEGPIVTQPLRENITVLIGSGANIVVLSGDHGKFLVDGGISVSE